MHEHTNEVCMHDNDYRGKNVMLILNPEIPWPIDNLPFEINVLALIAIYIYTSLIL